MSIFNLNIPKFPSVPDLPGVPNVLRNPLAAATTLLAPVIGNFLDDLLPSNKWAILDKNGKNAINPDNFLSIEVVDPYSISSFPVEKGSFADYNKIKRPFTVSVKMSAGGTIADRQSFLIDLYTLETSTDLYSIVTPEITYLHVNMERFDMRREARNGASIIIVDCHFQEIKQGKTLYSGQTSVPPKYQTNPTTSSGLIDPSKVTSPMAAAVSSMGMVSPQVCSAPVVQTVQSAVAGW